MKKLVIALILIVCPAMAQEPDFLQLYPIWIPVADHDASFPKLVVGAIKITPYPGKFNDLCKNAARLQDALIIYFNENPVFQKEIVTKQRAALGYKLLPVAAKVLPEKSAFLIEIEFNNNMPEEPTLNAMLGCFAYMAKPGGAR